MKYPRVRDEWATLTQLHRGYSIARLGDGELKMMDGRSYCRQEGMQRLAEELRSVFLRAHPMCLVGIPTMDPEGPKYLSWDRHRDRFIRLLEGSEVPRYYSAFISRPDSAPWINCKAFALALCHLWTSKRVAVLCEPQNSLLKLVTMHASSVDHIECPSHQAYDRIDEFERKLLRYDPGVIVMSCGPTATCLANRFAAKGFQALDLGSAGGFLLKLLTAA